MWKNMKINYSVYCLDVFMTYFMSLYFFIAAHVCALVASVLCILHQTEVPCNWTQFCMSLCLVTFNNSKKCLRTHGSFLCSIPHLSMLSQTESTHLSDTWSENSWCQNCSHKSSDTVAEAGIFQNTWVCCVSSCEECRKVWRCTNCKFLVTGSPEKCPCWPSFLMLLCLRNRDK